MFQARGIQLGNLESEVAHLQSEAKTAMLVAIDNEAAGIIVVADTIKDSSKDAMAFSSVFVVTNSLRLRGVKI